MLKQSKPLEYYLCERCNFGKGYNWYGQKGSFYNGSMPVKQCPRCGFIDDSRSLGGEDKNKLGIKIQSIDY